MTPTRLRVVTPERLDALVSNLVNTAGTATSTAVATKAGTSTGGSTTGVTSATANTVMGRDASARSQVANPAVNADVANMGWTNTAISTYVTGQLGVASGIASLNSSSVLNSTQVPTYLHQHRGTGTAFPTGIRAGDTYFHSGVGCLFTYDGTNWRQAEEFSVANNAAVTAISTTYSSVLHVGFRVWQTDKTIEWMWNGSAWNPTVPTQISGKIWRAAGFAGISASYNVVYRVAFDTSRLSGGFTADLTASTLIVPFDGQYRLLGRTYITGSSGYSVACSMARIRASVGDVDLGFSVAYKSDANDYTFPFGGTYPLKAGDQIYMNYKMLTNAAIVNQYWGNSEHNGVMIEATYHSPLNGATPL